MARRRKTGAMDDIAELVARLPWWAGVALALVLYLVLHSVASQPVVIDAQPGKIGDSVVRGMGQALANIGQYLLPFICLIGAAMSAWRRRERKSLLAHATESKAADALDGMSWREFEMLVGEGFRLQGYEVVETGRGGADGGVDLVLTRKGRNGNEKFLVQCKQWRAFKVGVDVVRELYGVMTARGATGGFVVTSGRFTAEAVDFASGRNVTLVDGPKLHGLMRQAKAAGEGSAVKPVAPSPMQPTAQPVQAVSCPLCSKPMVRRTARRGANPGSEFWGCTAYPVCRGTRPVA